MSVSISSAGGCQGPGRWGRALLNSRELPRPEIWVPPGSLEGHQGRSVAEGLSCLYSPQVGPLWPCHWGACLPSPQQTSHTLDLYLPVRFPFPGGCFLPFGFLLVLVLTQNGQSRALKLTPRGQSSRHQFCHLPWTGRGSCLSR